MHAIETLHSVCARDRNYSAVPDHTIVGAQTGSRSPRARLGSIVVLVVLLLCSCSHVDDDISDARIVVGKSIEGIELGDDRQRIVELLGEPTSELEGDGPFKRLFYDTHGMETYVASASVGAPFMVTSVRVEAPYDGTTSNGVGIGSSRSVVVSLLGHPTGSESNPDSTLDIYRNRRFKSYRAEEVCFWFNYRNQTLVRITMIRC